MNSDQAARTASDFCSMRCRAALTQNDCVLEWQTVRKKPKRGSVLSDQHRNQATQSDNTENTFTSDKLPHPWSPTISSSPPTSFEIEKQSENDKFGFANPRVCAGMRLEEIQVLEEKGQSLHLDR